MEIQLKAESCEISSSSRGIVLDIKDLDLNNTTRSDIVSLSKLLWNTDCTTFILTIGEDDILNELDTYKICRYVEKNLLDDLDEDMILQQAKKIERIRKINSI